MRSAFPLLLAGEVAERSDVGEVGPRGPSPSSPAAMPPPPRVGEESRANFPWARLMQIGIGALHLSPEQFWKTTLKEITAASSPAQNPEMKREALEGLMQQWPDE
jgi:uncharacterized phage protein (TIGR02216 family)